jgi:hypothetical protein
MNKFFTIIAIGLLTVNPSGAQDMTRLDQTKSTPTKLKLPAEIGAVEGPRDMSDCAIRPQLVEATKADGNLRTWCILPEECTKVYPPRDTSYCGIEPRTSHDTQLKQIWLKRPGSKCCVAIVEVDAHKKVILNPPGFDYGPIPPLHDITPSQADELWGSDSGKTVQGNIHTYKLTSYIEPHQASIDLVFEKNKLQKYRVTSSEIDSSDWYQVQ